MKKIQYIEAITDWLASDLSGEQRMKFHPEIISVHLNNVFNQVIYNTWLNAKKFSDFSQLDAWSKVFEVEVREQVGTSAYAILPFAPVQLPDNMGIRQVCDHANNDNVFAYIEATSNVIFADLEVDTMDSTPTFRLEQNNTQTGAGIPSHILRLEKLPVAPDAITSIDVMMIVPFEQLDDYDDVAAPSGAEDDIIKTVINLLLNKPQPDSANDMVIKYIKE